MRVFLLSTLILIGAGFGCSPVEPTNPYDPGTATTLQARAVLSGRVLLEEPGASVSGITVRLYDLEGALVTDADGAPRVVNVEPLDGDGGLQGLGSFQIPNLAPGTYRLDLDVDVRFAAPTLPEVKLGPGEERSVGTLRYTKINVGTGRVRGQVELRHAQGGPREVRLYRSTGEGLEIVAQQRTDAAGRFDLVGLPPGTYAVSAELSGFTPDFRAGFQIVDEPKGLTGEVAFTNDDALVLHPVTAVLEPGVQQLFGEYYTSDRLLPITVLAFGAMNEMRLSTDPAFASDEGEELPFEPYAASTTVPLPQREGRLTVYAQFRNTTDARFPFTSPVFTATVVRDATAPVIVAMNTSGVRQDAQGVRWVVEPEAAVGVTLEGNDLHSAVASYAVVPGEGDAPPDPQTISFQSLDAPAGLMRVEQEVRLSAGEGTKRLWAFVRDRAGNTSEPGLVELEVDTRAPLLVAPLAPVNATEGGVLTEPVARFELALQDECDGEPEACAVEMKLGLQPLGSGAAFEAFAPAVSVEVPATHDQVVQFEAHLRDRAGNTTRVTSAAYRLELMGTLQGRAFVEGASQDAPAHGGISVQLFAPGADPASAAPVAQTSTTPEGRFVLGPLPQGRGYQLVLVRAGTRGFEAQGIEVVRNEVGSLGPYTLPLARGEVVGRFRLADLKGSDDAHGGILVSAFLGEQVVRQTVTALDGTYRFADPGLPVNAPGGSYTLLATRNGYVPRQVDGVAVSRDEMVVVHESSEEPGVPQALELSLIGGDFDLCPPSGDCRSTLYTRHSTARIRLRAVDADEIRFQARTAFAADDEAPAWQPLEKDVLPVVDLSGADGEIEVFVQLRAGGVAGPVLRSTIVLDTVPPTDARVTLERGPAALADGFTNATLVRARVEASAGAGVDVAPLRTGWVHFAEQAPVGVPSGATACAFGGSCLVPLSADEGGVAEGTHTAWAFACDEAGNCSEAPVSARIVYDRTAPSVAHGVSLEAVSEQLRLLNGVAFSRANLFRVALGVGAARTADGEPSAGLDGAARADVAGFRFGYTPALEGAWRAFELPPAASETREVEAPTLPAQDGRYTLYAQLVDAAGNASVVGTPGTTLEVELDSKPPSGTFTLNGGAELTADPLVTLGLTQPAGEPGPAVEIVVSRDGGLFEEVETLALPLTSETRLWTLPAGAAPEGDGIHTVYARMVDAAGNVSDRTASIRLDRTPPMTLSVRCGSCLADPSTGALYTSAADRAVVLDLLAADAAGPVDSVVVVVDGAAPVVQPYAGALQVLLPDADGPHEVDVAFRDRAGNTGEPTRLIITLDRQAPVVVATLEGAGPSANHSSSPQVGVQLTAQADGAPITGLRLSNTSTFSGSKQPFVESLGWTLGTPELDGEKTVYVEVTDAAGNVTVTSASVVLDQTPPDAALVLDGGGAWATQRTVTAVVTASDAISGAVALSMQLSSDPTFANASWQPLSATSAFELPAGDGAKSVFLRVRDEAGNVGTASASIVLDTEAPAGATIGLPGQWTRTTTLAVSLTTPGATEMCLWGDFVGTVEDECAGASLGWRPVASSAALTLTTGDGRKALSVVTRDAAGHTSAPASTSIVLDTTPPGARVVEVNLGASATASPFVTVALSADDELSGVAGLALSAGTLDCSSAVYEPFVPSRTFTLAGPDGEKTLFACFRDGAGNAAAASAVIVLDQTPPAGVTLSLAGGAAYATTPQVLAALAASDNLTPAAGLTMQLANDPSFSSSSWEPFVASKLVTLSDGDGAKAVYLRVRDEAGNVSHASASITLDTQPPSHPSISLSSGDQTNATAVTARLSATGASSMCLFGDVVGAPADGCVAGSSGWIPFAATRALTLTASPGTKTVRARFRDDAGLLSDPVSAITILDTQAPAGLSVSIDGGSAMTASRHVSLELSATDGGSGVSGVAVSNGPLTCASAAYEPFTPTRAWTLTAGDGEKTVTVCFRDAAGNSASAFAQTVLDTTPPSGLSLQLAGGATHTSNRVVSAALTAVDARTAVDDLVMEVTLQSSPTNAWVPFAPVASVELPESDGLRVVYLHVRDLAGNVATTNSSIVVDTGSPDDPSLSLSPATYAASPTVSVTLSAAGATQMCLWGDFDGSTDACPGDSPRWETFVAAKTIGLTGGDGVKYVRARFRDAAGNVTDEIFASVVLDTTPPDVSQAVVELEGTIFGSTVSTVRTRLTSVELRVSEAFDASSGLTQMMVSESPAFAGAGWEPWQSSLQRTLSPGDGTKTFYVKLRDAAGWESTVLSGAIVLDTIPPNGTVILAGGAPSTSAVPVQVALGTDAVGGAVEVQTSWTGVLPDPYTASRTPFAASLPLLPPAGDGTKTLLVRFFDAAGNYVERSASVVLDTTPPAASATVACATCTRDSAGRRFFRSPDGGVELALFASDDSGAVAQVRVVVDEDEDGAQVFEYAPTLPVVVSTDEGAHLVEVTFLDPAGNARTPPALELVYDVTPPALSVTLNGGAPVTRHMTAALQLTATDAHEVVTAYVSDVPTFAGAPAQAFAPTLAWALPSPQTDGQKTVYVKVLDAAGNAAEATANIELDTTPPSDVSLALSVGSHTKTTSLQATLGATGATHFRLSGDVAPSADTFQWVAMRETVALELVEGDGLKTVHVHYRDAAGNLSERVSATTTLDTVAPAFASVQLIGRNVDGTPNTAATAVRDVEMSIVASGAEWMSLYTGTLPFDCQTATYDTPFASTSSFTVTPGVGGIGRVQVCLRDAAGNVAGPLVDTILVDESPPSCTVTLRGYRADQTYVSPLNDTHTATTGVDLISSCAGDPVAMAVVSSDQAIACATASYTTFAQTRRVTLPAGDGSKNVSACFRDHVGNYTPAPISAATGLILDQTPPDAGALFIARANESEPATHTPARPVDVFLSATGAAEMVVGTSPISAAWQAYDTGARRISLPALKPMEACAVRPNGVQRDVYAAFRDELRNTSSVVSSSIVLDTCPPLAPVVTVKGSPGAIDDDWVNERTVVAVIGNRVNATRMRVAPGTTSCPVASSSLYESVPLASTATVTFPGDGPRRVCVLLEDDAGNLSTPAFDSFTIDTVPPVAPGLSPGNLTNVNRACADITPQGSVDANFDRWQVRVPGGAWRDKATSGGALRFDLLQDRDNILEVRAVDKAGNVGEANAAFVQEVSSVVVPTSLSMKMVCGSGRYVLLKDLSIGQTITTGPECSTTLGSLNGRSATRLLGSLPRHELLDLETMSVHRLDGAAGLAGNLPLSAYSRIVDAACSAEEEALLVTYAYSLGNCDNGVSGYRVNMYVYPDPIDDPAASAWNGGGPVRQYGGRYAQSIHSPGDASVDVSITSVDVVDWTDTSTWDFRAFAVHSALNSYLSPVRVEANPSESYVTVSANYESVFFPLSANQNYVRGLSIFGAQSHWLKYTNGSGWDIMQAAAASSTTSRVFRYPQGAGFTAGNSPWGSRVKPASVWHSGTPQEARLGSVYSDELGVANFLLGDYVGSGGGSLVLGNGAPANAYPAIFDHARLEVDWVDAADPTVIRRHDNYAVNDVRSFRYPVDTRKPIFSTTKDGPGQPFVVYHTTSQAQGVVVGFENEEGCAK